MRGLWNRLLRLSAALVLVVLALVLAAAPAAAASVDIGFGVTPAIVAVHYVQSGWEYPEFVIAEMVLGPARIGGLYIGGIGLRQIDGFGTVYPLVSYVGQGSVPKLKFLKGVTVTFAMANEGIFSGKPAYFFGVGVSIGK